MALNLPKVSDAAAEGGAVCGVLVHLFEGATANAERHGREGEALDLEVAHHVKQGATLFADEVGGRHDTILEDQFRGVRRAHAGLVHDLLTDAVPGHAGLHEEGAHLHATLVVLAGAGVDPNHVSGRAFFVEHTVGDPHLAAVEQPRAVGLLDRVGAQAEDVGSRVRLRHRHRTDPLT